MLKTIGKICVMLERKKYFASCKVLKNWKYDTLLKEFKKMVEIRGRALMFSRGERPKIDKVSFHRTKM